MRAVRRAERVQHEQVPSLCEPPGSLGVVLRLAGIEAGVLEDTNAIVRQQLPETCGDGCDLELGIGPLGAAEMRADDDLSSAGVEQVAQCQERSLDTRVVRDAAVLERDVEIGADENAPARNVRSTDGTGRVDQGRSFPIRSTSRHEYPHSLSYQPNTLTVLPCTIVSSLSKMQE